MLRPPRVCRWVAPFALLAFSGGAGSAAPANRQSPALEVITGSRVPAAGAVTVSYSQNPDDLAPTRIAFRVPEEFVFVPDGNGAARGSSVGSSIIFIGNSPVWHTGVMTMEHPGAFAAEGLACTGNSTHTAVWTFTLGSPTGVVKTPIFVDGRTFTLCPDAARLGGTPTSIALDLGLVGDTVNRPLVLGPQVPGSYVWSATVTRPGLPDVEIRGLIDLPQTATFTARVVRESVHIAGRVTANGRGSGGLRVDAVLNKRRGKEIRLSGFTRADGRFMIVHRLARGTFDVRVYVEPDTRDVTSTDCAGPSPAAGGCVSATRRLMGLGARPAVVQIISKGKR